MNGTIDLVEYRPSPVMLAAEDRDWLLGPASSVFSLVPIAGSDAWWLGCGPTVGVVALPSGRLVRCNPKAPVRNVFFMLATAYGFRDPFLDQPIEFERIDELFDFLVEHLANLVDQRLEAGLYRSYVEREENLAAVRGRIMIAHDVRQNAILRHRTYCLYSEFTWDIPENRIIRQTVFAMSRLVRRPDLQRRLAALDRMLGEIDPAPLPPAVFSTFHYHRMNDDYRTIHRLCELLLQGASVSERFGDYGFRAFLLDMNRLYESFLTVALREALPHPWSTVDQHWSHLDDARSIAIRPDLVLMHEGKRTLIGDAKYKLRATNDAIHHDLYQVLAYCTAEGIDRGMLIYPAWEGAGRGTISIRNSPVRIVREMVDLGGTVDGLRDEVRRLAARMMAGESDVAVETSA